MGWIKGYWRMIGGIVLILSVIGGLLSIDDRYAKSAVLEISIKNSDIKLNQVAKKSIEVFEQFQAQQDVKFSTYQQMTDIQFLNIKHDILNDQIFRIIKFDLSENPNDQLLLQDIALLTQRRDEIKSQIHIKLNK